MQSGHEDPPSDASCMLEDQQSSGCVVSGQGSRLRVEGWVYRVYGFGVESFGASVFGVYGLRFRVLSCAGDVSRPCVWAANRLAKRVCYLMEMNFRMGVCDVTEQPSTSLLFTYRCIRDP